MSARFKLLDQVVEPDAGSLSGPQGVTHLEPRVMGVLERLAQRAGETVSKESLVRAVWNGRHVSDDAIHRTIAVLRRLLGDSAAEQKLIQTVPKKGYRLLVPVEFLEPPAATKTPSELTLEAILGSCSDHIYVYDAEGRYLLASRAGAQAIGLATGDMIGKSWRELRMPAEIMEPFQRQVAAVFRGGESARQIVAYPTIYGQKTYEYVLDPIHHGGEVIAVMAIVREIGDAERSG